MPVCDYILLASLKSNIGLVPYSGNLSETSFLEANLPEYIITYSKNLLGLKQIADNTNTVKSGGDFTTLNNLDKLYTQGYDIWMLIDMQMLTNGTKFSAFPNHWVLYKGNLLINSTENKASFSVFTWGESKFHKITINESYFKKYFYGYIKAKW